MKPISTGHKLNSLFDIDTLKRSFEVQNNELNGTSMLAPDIANRSLIEPYAKHNNSIIIPKIRANKQINNLKERIRQRDSELADLK